MRGVRDGRRARDHASVDIRPLRPADLVDGAEADEVAVVIDAGLGLARLNQGDGCYLVAWDGDAPVGHVHLALTDPPELQDLEVLPAHRRRGIATGLVAAAEDEARGRGFAAIHLEVSADDIAAQRLYATCGYGDAGLPPRRVQGKVMIRTGPIEVDDSLLTWTKPLT